MGQILHDIATTTQSVEQYKIVRALEGAFETLSDQSKDGCEVEERTSFCDLATGPKEPKSTVLSFEEEAVIVAFRKHTLLPPADCLYSLQPSIPHLTGYRCTDVCNVTTFPDCLKSMATSRLDV